MSTDEAYPELDGEVVAASKHILTDGCAIPWVLMA